MIELGSDPDPTQECKLKSFPVTFHNSFYLIYARLRKWLNRFPNATDLSLFKDLNLLYNLSTKKFLDHRDENHLFRLSLSIHLMKNKLLRLSTFSDHVRHLQIRWIPTNLLFPFVNKPVLGCLIGFNLMDRYELFDDENIVLALRKYLPQLQLVKESSYCHHSEYKNLKLFYFEIEKKNNHLFSLSEQILLKNKLHEQVKKSIQPLSPAIFMGLNDEEIYKNVLVLSQEIQSLNDLPQAFITFEHQTGKEIVFRINLVYISPFHRFSLKERFPDNHFVSQRVLIVKHLEDHPIEAHVFRIHLNRDAAFLRSNGSLDFYSARKKVVVLINNAVGDFRDYNGGIILKQQELLSDFRNRFIDIAEKDPEILESFFYTIFPLEKQVVLPLEILSMLFQNFLESRKEVLPPESTYLFKIYRTTDQVFLCVHGEDSTLATTISEILKEQSFTYLDYAYSLVHVVEGVYFNCVLQSNSAQTEKCVHMLQESLYKWHQKLQQKQILRIGVEYSILSLDPRIGGEAASGDVLRLLYEGLTRFHQNGTIEKGVAESIELSPNNKIYTFKLRQALWNDGTPVTAYDFEYAWKKILSPEFHTSFAYLFFPIKNAKEAKMGEVSLDKVGIEVLNERTLRVELVRPAPFFLQSTVHPLFSPIHRIVDQQQPQWPYYSGDNYPCNGPFCLAVNEPNQGYKLTKNPLYWDSANVQLDQVTLTVMNPTQALNAFHKSELDWIGSPFGAWHPIYSDKKDSTILTLPDSWVCWCIFNTSCPYFKNLKLRQAFAYAIQRSQIVQQSFLPLNPAFSLLLPYYQENNQPLYPDFNPEKSRELFDEALNELKLKKEDFKTISLVFLEKGIREFTAKCIQQQLKSCLGIEVNLKPLPWNILFHSLTEGNFQLGLMHWNSWIDDLIYTTFNAFKFAKQELNFSKWENASFQEYINLSENETNPFQRSFYLKKAEEILSEETPIIPLFYQPYQALIKKDLNIIYRPPCGPFNISRSYFSKNEERSSS